MMKTTTITLVPGGVVEVELLGPTVFSLNEDGQEFWLSSTPGEWALESAACFRSADCPVTIDVRGTVYLKGRPSYEETVGVSLVSSEART